MYRNTLIAAATVPLVLVGVPFVYRSLTKQNDTVIVKLIVCLLLITNNNVHNILIIINILMICLNKY